MKNFLLIFVILTFHLNAYAVTAQEENFIDKIAQDFDSTKKNIEENELQQRKVMATLYEINKETKRLVKNRSSLQTQKNVTQANIQKLAQKTEELSQKSKTQKALLAERLRAIYQIGGPSMARLLFSSQSSSDLERNLKILGFVAKRDMDLIRDYNKTQKELSRKKEKLLNRMAHLKSLDVKIAVEEHKLQKEAQKRNVVLTDIRKSSEFAYKKIDQIREKSLQYHIEDSGIFDLLFKPSFADQKGLLNLPVAGTVRHRFGIEKELNQPYVIANKGIFIETGYSKNVVSVFDGIVSFVGDMPGFGKTVIIDHGDHYYTVYAFNQVIKVNSGDEIKRDQVIAVSGENRFDEQKGIYFEIRHFSEPYDPQKWMKGISL